MKRAISTICAVGIAGVAYCAVATTLHLTDDEPSWATTLHLVVLTMFTVGMLVACGWAFVLRVEAGQRRIVAQVDADHRAAIVRIETEQRAATVRSDRRYQILRTGLVSLGARIEESTGEIRRRAGVPERATVPAIDPHVVRLLHELDSELGGHSEQ